VLDGAVANEVIGVESDKMVAVRSRSSGGFLIAAVTSAETRFPHLYEVETDGSSKDRGEYHMGSIELSAVNALEPSGAMISIVELAEPFADGIVRLRLDVPPEVIFDERVSGVQLHGSALVTGP
jgi:hypothetical protein